jgi:Tol biopolymer transport system component
MNIKKLLFIPIFLLQLALANGQFYNGLQMTFGKNRVQYNTFYWQYFRYPKFDTYFNEYGRELAIYTEWVANQEIERIEKLLDYTLERRVIFLVYNKLSDFRQSNIGLVTGNEDYNTGGITKIVKNKVFLYYEGDRRSFRKQISAGIAEVILSEMLYGAEFGQNLTNQAVINLPTWYLRGLISYISEDWSIETENRVKDGILSGKYEHFNKLIGDDAMYAGHSFWRYIEKNYGANLVPNIVYITRINKSAKSGFLYVLGSSIKQLADEWLGYYMSMYQNGNSDANEDEVPIIEKPKKKRLYQKMKVSPDGTHISFVTNEMGQYKVWIYNKETKKIRKIYKREHKLDQIPDFSQPAISWHPGGKILTFITEEKGFLKLSFYNLETKELVQRNLLYFDKILDFSFSSDGAKLVFSAVKEGRTDIFVHTLASSTNEQITNDLADDLFPRFADNSTKIIFSSNRKSDSLSMASPEVKELAPAYALYVYNYASRSDVLSRVTDNRYANHTYPIELSKNRYSYLSDANGIFNRYIADYDSVIAFIDTTIHYRFFSKSYPVTNNDNNFLEHDIIPQTSDAGNVRLKKGRLYMFMEKLKPFGSLPLKLADTEYRKELNSKYQRKDSLTQMRQLPVTVRPPDVRRNLPSAGDTSKIVTSSEIDIDNYIFEIEKLNIGTRGSGSVSAVTRVDSDTLPDRPEQKQRIYQTAFYINYLVSQADFNFLNASYQAFNGSQVYYNPGFNGLIKLGTNDLFEDYKIVGGVRLSFDFESNEYLLSFENLKRRWDKEYVYHRQSFQSITADEQFLVKTTTQQVFYVLKYPFSQVLSARGTVSFRHDRNALLATEPATLDADNFNNAWAGLKLELVFDNTRSLGINIYSGTRYKIFGEAYKQVNRSKSDLFVLGADFRHYQVLHRNLIWANRFATSTSFGGSRLVYYLGSVDNWINLSSKVKTFDNTIRVDDQAKYAYQTVATNMRGFTQNIRNGNNFAVFNSEIRWPFIKYFSRYPASSNFWSSLQAVGFFDIGSAWTGLTPFSGGNAYEYDIVKQNPITVYVDSNRSPIVYGFGYGLRAQVLGYFMRFDWAWGVEKDVILPRIFYFSLSTDF